MVMRHTPRAVVLRKPGVLLNCCERHGKLELNERQNLIYRLESGLVRPRLRGTQVSSLNRRAEKLLE